MHMIILVFFPVFVVVTSIPLIFQQEARVNTPVEAPVKVLLSEKNVIPEKRKIIRTWEFSREGIELLDEYLNSAKEKKIGYIISTYYIQLPNGEIWGIVEKTSEDPLAIDVTNGNALEVWTTAPHTLLINDDFELGERLIEEIKKQPSTSEK